jgi:hypothetical protein
MDDLIKRADWLQAGQDDPHSGTIRELIAALRASAEREKRMALAIVWALGYTDFRGREEGEGAYWWRKELSTRAGLSDADCRDILRDALEKGPRG